MYNGSMSIGARFVIPQVVATHFHLREGDVVADYGAGSGFFLPVLTSAVKGTGRVYACEIQKPLVEKLGDFARATIALQGTSEANVERYMQVRNNRTRRNIAFASPMASSECSCTRKHGSGNGDG